MASPAAHGPQFPSFVMLVTELGDKTSYLLLLTHNISYSHYNKNLGLDVLKGFLGVCEMGSYIAPAGLKLAM